MSKPSWESSLAQAARRRQPSDRPLRIAVVGIGHELRGDDAAGVVVARALLEQSAICDPRSAFRLVIDAGPAPENYTGSLRRFQPDLIVLIDAAQMGAPPGTVRWLMWQDTDAFSASTHTLPPHILAQYLTNELNCGVALIGIQPADTRIGMPLSPVVQAAVETVVQALLEELLSDKCLAAA